MINQTRIGCKRKASDQSIGDDFTMPRSDQWDCELVLTWQTKIKTVWHEIDWNSQQPDAEISGNCHVSMSSGLYSYLQILEKAGMRAFFFFFYFSLVFSCVDFFWGCVCFLFSIYIWMINQIDHNSRNTMSWVCLRWFVIFPLYKPSF